MRKFLINVNGTSYEVEVEEVGGGSFAGTPIQSAPVAVPQSAPKAPAPAAPKAAPPSGGTSMTCPMPGTIVDIRAAVGKTVKKGEVILVLEAMKMENEICAAVDGTVSFIGPQKGDSVNSGDLLVTIS